jgi:hypothetical protein
MKFNEYCMKIVFFVILILIFYFQTYSVYGIEKEIQTNNKELVQILQNYWQWFGNSPEDSPDNNPKCSIHIDTNNSIVFLLNPFETGDTSYDCTDTPIPQQYSLLFPLLSSFCSQGDVGLYGKSYEEIRDCALSLDRGTIKGNVAIDGKEIVDIFIDNGNGIDMNKNKKVINNLPQSSQYYKEIFSEEFINILVTSNTTMANNWEEDEYKENPIYYNGVVHCDCIIIDIDNLETGTHTLEYTISAKAEPPSPTLIADRWDFTSNTNYKLAIQ